MGGEPEEKRTPEERGAEEYRRCFERRSRPCRSFCERIGVPDGYVLTGPVLGQHMRRPPTSAAYERGAVPNCRGSRETGVILNPLWVKDPQARSRPVCTLGPLQAGAFRVTHEENRIPMYRFIPYNLELHPYESYLKR
jgi:hypothetical protein